jgi:hypothetical protein
MARLPGSVPWRRPMSLRVSQGPAPTRSTFLCRSAPPCCAELQTSRGAPEELAVSRQILRDLQQRIRPSVRPFTLADHLITYCHHNEWARGLMFHEYHRVPESFVELARDSQPRIPRTVVKPKLVSSS